MKGRNHLVYEDVRVEGSIMGRNGVNFIEGKDRKHGGFL